MPEAGVGASVLKPAGWFAPEFLWAFTRSFTTQLSFSRLRRWERTGGPQRTLLFVLGAQSARDSARTGV